ncbi:hypothetical protein GCM10025787_36110 [Saccharopolyspora rosea]
MTHKSKCCERKQNDGTYCLLIPAHRHPSLSSLASVVNGFPSDTEAGCTQEETATL